MSDANSAGTHWGQVADDFSQPYQGAVRCGTRQPDPSHPVAGYACWTEQDSRSVAGRLKCFVYPFDVSDRGSGRQRHGLSGELVSNRDERT